MRSCRSYGTEEFCEKKRDKRQKFNFGDRMNEDFLLKVLGK